MIHFELERLERKIVVEALQICSTTLTSPVYASLFNNLKSSGQINNLTPQELELLSTILDQTATKLETTARLVRKVQRLSETMNKHK